MLKLLTSRQAIVIAVAIAFASTGTHLHAQNNSAQHLQYNQCFMDLQDNDRVIVTAAFHSGAEGFTDLQQLIARKPWGEALSTAQREEITKLQKEASPFLILTLSKKQALLLEDHRDLIKWILVQSTTKPCT